MKTTKSKLKTTTTPYDDFEFYEYEDFEFPQIEMEQKIREFNLVAIFVAIFGIALNVFNAFILTRKEIKKDYVFRSILIVCVCDITLFSDTIFWNVLDQEVVKNVNGLYGVVREFLRRSVLATERMTRNISVTVVLVLSVSKYFENLRKYSMRASIAISGVFVIWHAVWSYFYYQIYKVFDNERSDDFEMFFNYELLIDENYIHTFTVMSNLSTFLSIVSLLVSCAFQFRKLRLIIRDQNGEDDHSILVYLISVSMLISELIDGFVIVFSLVWLRPYYILQEFYVHIQRDTRIIISINCVTHCFICLLTSSEYSAAVKKYTTRIKKVEISEIRSVSTNRTTGGTHESY